ncbi:MAG: bifunctional riboflavin kinase/FAD synthetase [Roseburia sp.]
MKYIRNTTEFHMEKPTVLSLGKFDGIHRGHELLLEQLAKKREEGLATVIFTFDIPPRKNVAKVESQVLTTNEEKMHRFARMGIDYLVECPFTSEIMCMEAEDFLRKIVEELKVRCFVVGDDFHFGHNRRGDYRMLNQYADAYGYQVIVVEKMKEDRRDISSTFVREEIAAGNIEKANHLLGYRYFVSGRVEHGNRIGRTIGIPTMNQLPPPEKLLPPFGVYVTEALIGEQCYRGVTNVGCKPTIAGNNPVGVETHLLDFAGNVYEEFVTVEFLSRVRSEKKFESIDELKKQMQNDIAYARAYFGKNIT